MNDEMIALVAPDTATTSCESERRHFLGVLRKMGFELPLAPKQFTAACGVILIFVHGERNVQLSERYDRLFELRIPASPGESQIVITGEVFADVLALARRAEVIP
jgi:hypothetical protein